MLILEYLISADGKVQDVCVLQPASPTVDAHFVRLAKETRFSPGTLCGIPAPFALVVTINHHAWEWRRLPD